jgi:hypothetical protein
MSSIKDIIDALASAVSIIPHHMSVSRMSDDSKAHLEYLRNSGAPASYIEQQATRYAREDQTADTMQDYLQLVHGGY